MTVQNSNGTPFIWAPAKHPWVELNALPTAVDITIDAANEYAHINGYCVLEGKSGSKTISSAGGKIHFLVGAATITFSDASTNLRVGIQDMSTSGVPGRGDGTFDVYDDLVGGTDTLTATTWKTVTMSSGSKTISHGEKISVVIGMTARGGTDSMKVRGASTPSGLASQFPNSTFESGGSFSATAQIPNIVIEFDDGTLGTLLGSWVTSTGALSTTTSFDNASTPDEYCNILRWQYPVNVFGISVQVRPEANASDLELILYSDPLGTPSAIETVTVTAANFHSTASVRSAFVALSTVRSLSANTDYAVAIRPTSANNISIATHDVNAAAHWNTMDMGDECYMATRTNQTGAFSGTTTQRVFGLSVCLCGFGDDAGGAAPIASGRGSRTHIRR